MEPETEMASVASETTGVVGGEEPAQQFAVGSVIWLGHGTDIGSAGSKRGTALFHVKLIPKLWLGCVAERLLRLRLSARYRTEHGDDDPETGLVQVRFHDGRSFSDEETHRGRPLV